MDQFLQIQILTSQKPGEWEDKTGALVASWFLFFCHLVPGRVTPETAAHRWTRGWVNCGGQISHRVGCENQWDFDLCFVCSKGTVNIKTIPVFKFKKGSLFTFESFLSYIVHRPNATGEKTLAACICFHAATPSSQAQPQRSLHAHVLAGRSRILTQSGSTGVSCHQDCYILHTHLLVSIREQCTWGQCFFLTVHVSLELHYL